MHICSYMYNIYTYTHNYHFTLDCNHYPRQHAYLLKALDQETNFLDLNPDLSTLTKRVRLDKLFNPFVPQFLLLYEIISI